MGVMQGGIPSPILFDFIIKKIIDGAAVSGVKFSFDSNNFSHGKNDIA